MFIKELYQFNRATFFMFTAYIILFIFFNYKWGFTVCPVIQYGMYSELESIKDTIRISKPNIISKETINMENLTPYIRECLIFYYNNFNDSESKWNVITQTFNRIFRLNLKNDFNYPNNFEFNEFNRIYIGKQLGVPIDSIQYIEELYIWENLKFRQLK